MNNYSKKDIENHMQILGFSPNKKISIKEIKKRFKELSFEKHPDMNNANDEMVKIIDAYKNLIDFMEKMQINIIEEYVNRLLTEKELWQHKFSDDPLWGGGGNW